MYDPKAEYNTKGSVLMTVIPVFDSILVPDVNLYFKKSMFEAAAGHEPAAGEQVVLLPAKTAIEDRKSVV